MNSELRSERMWDIGMLNRRAFREFLQKLRYDGAVDDWHERNLFWSSYFTVRGTPQAQSLISGFCQEREQ